MGEDIAENLELMCDRNNPQDKKILLLARLMQGRFETLSDNQEELKSSLSDTNKKLDRIISIIDQYETSIKECPVSKNKELIETFFLFIKYPKLSFLITVGIVSVLGGLISSSFMDMLKAFFGI